MRAFSDFRATNALGVIRATRGIGATNGAIIEYNVQLCINYDDSETVSLNLLNIHVINTFGIARLVAVEYCHINRLDPAGCILHNCRVR